MTQDKKKEYQRQYRETHKELIHSKDKAYYNSRKDDPEFMEKRRKRVREWRKRVREWRKNHPNNDPAEVKAFRERMSARYKAMTPEEKKEYNHQRYLRRREKALAYAKAHSKPNSAKINKVLSQDLDSNE